MKLPCDCCEGPDVLTPLATANRPGLSALRYRVGTHATFFETMQARLSSDEFPELAALKTRERNDPGLALLDAWATVGDVLTFYQERIANEGYLRTATERRSVLEQARLVGYRLRPGVASSVHLAYTIEKNSQPVEITEGARVNSIPAPGEQMQAFETSEPLEARYEWNGLKPRMTQPQTPTSIWENGLYLKGTATNLKLNDGLLIDFANEKKPTAFRVYDVKPDNKADRTLITLRMWDGSNIPPLTEPDEESCIKKAPQEEITVLLNQVFWEKLKAPPSIPPKSPKQLERSVRSTFAAQAEIFPQLLSTLSPRLHSVLYPALAGAQVTEKPEIKVYALRKVASLFGHNAPKEPQYEPPFLPREEGSSQSQLVPNPNAGNLKPQNQWCEWTIADDEAENVAYLDTVYDQVVAGSHVVIQQPPFTASSAVIATVDNAVTMSRAAYGLTGKISRLAFNEKWWNPEKVKVSSPDASSSNPDDSSTCNDATLFETVRRTTVYCQSEELALAEEVIHEDICDDEIELDGLYDGLEPGRWMIISGERADIPGTTGVKASELVMLAEIIQKTQTRTLSVSMRESNDNQPIEEPLPGDKLHTFIRFDKELAYCYRRDTITIYGNVVKATHGETRREVLGSGDAAKAFQSFQLKQAPLTYVSAPTVSGIESTLEIRVNDVQWHETGGLPALGRNDRKFITFQDDNEKTSITFGNGERGARLPTGQENIKSVYRSGIGKPGNVKANQISLLATRPLGVKAVINPIRASGGADREGRDQARKNAPLALMALDRLVSTSDYADFTRTFAGIGKAAAARLADGRKQLVQVTIAGAEDIPIEVTSDLYRNLRDALHRHGDPHLPIQLKVRERLALVISAKVGVHPDYLWESLEPKIRTAVLDAFSFEKLELGDDLFLADAIRVIQSVPGVTYVDVEVFDTISENALLEGFTASADSVGSSFKLGHRISIESTQLAYLSPEVPDTLILQEIKS